MVCYVLSNTITVCCYSSWLAARSRSYTQSAHLRPRPPYTNVCAMSRALSQAACQVGCVAELPNYCTAFSLYRGVRAELMMAKCCACWVSVVKM